MKRCIECGRPYHSGLTGTALLELGLQELAEADLAEERLQDLVRVRKLARAASNRLDAEMTQRADHMAAAKL